MKVYIAQNTFLNGKVDCYSIEFAQGVSLIIEPGARLRIWEGGIVNSDAENTGLTNGYFVVRENAVTNQYGELLLHPSVTTNNKPKVNYQFFTTAYQTGNSSYNWCAFTVPNLNVQASSYYQGSIKTYDGQNLFTSLNEWDDKNDTWGQPLSNMNQVKSFHHYTNANNAETPGIRYTFKGQVELNLSKTIECLNLHIYFGNGFLGKISTVKMMSSLPSGISSVWVKKRVNNEDVWSKITEYNITEYPYIYPSEIIYLDSSTKPDYITLSYKELIWDPSFEPEVTPAQTRGTKGGSSPKSEPIDPKDLPQAGEPEGIGQPIEDEPSNNNQR